MNLTETFSKKNLCYGLSGVAIGIIFGAGCDALGRTRAAAQDDFVTKAEYTMTVGELRTLKAVMGDKFKQMNVRIVQERKYPENSVENFIMTDRKLEHIMTTSNPKLSEGRKHELKTYIVKYAKMYNVSPLFVAAIIQRETDFRDNQVSTTGCMGMMQVSPKHHEDKLKKLGLKPQDLQDADHGIHVGCMVLREYLDKAKGDYRNALAYYSGSKAKSDFANKYVNFVFKIVMNAHKAVEA